MWMFSPIVNVSPSLMTVSTACPCLDPPYTGMPGYDLSWVKSATIHRAEVSSLSVAYLAPRCRKGSPKRSVSATTV